ncbi:hypothetical protein HMPREF0501_01366 [Limosilactobacillus coleohominis 101-4-CHN]|uniref:Cell surface hydrolase n=1 Tax=Limosilactobacillus coleohominis 101-4-CHN TaxID=575594 RepID=C7XX81_9LACO|nr:hypothetical protein HMPREF0501_01366 [Limosilactobacillus coleohominis 101-4-CHN]
MGKQLPGRTPNGKWGDYAESAVKAVQKKYQIKNINLVGHSMGNIAIMYYLVNNAQKTNMPTVRHQVDIAGHFDGGIGFGYNKKTTLDSQGKPSIMEKHYRDFLPLRNTYPTTSLVIWMMVPSQIVKFHSTQHSL